MVLFMLGSGFVQSRLYIKQAPVAFVAGVITGPETAGLLNPFRWSNTRNVTLEFSRVILAIQCFGNAIELPKRYVQKRWQSLAWIIGPVMLCGWFITSCCVKLMVPSFDWRQALACAACFNAIDPVLAQSILSGRFGKRVPKHLRDLLRAEAAANGLTTTLVLDLTKYVLRYDSSPGKVASHFFSIAFPYEIPLGTIAGIFIGYLARRGLRKAWEMDYMDRASFLAYYLSVAMFAMGLGTIIGADEVNLCFFAGIGLDNDDWYQEKTDESFLASCIDSILNLSYFIFIGSLVPWRSFNSEGLDMVPWRLVVGTLCIFLFRRIPVVLAFKPIVSEIKTWREALFYGHFGPIGAGALFSALLVHGQLNPANESGSVNGPGLEKYHFQLWTVVMFVFVCSSVVHGTSIALFTLGRHVNTLQLTMSFTESNEPTWMDRLPNIQSRSKSQGISDFDIDEDVPYPRGTLPLAGRNPFLRRVKEQENPRIVATDMPSWTNRMCRSQSCPDFGSGQLDTIDGLNDTGRISRSLSCTDLIFIERDGESQSVLSPTSVGSEERGKFALSHSASQVYEEGDNTVYEDEDGNVLAVDPICNDEDCSSTSQSPKYSEPSNGRSSAGVPARAYQFGNTIIIEDEDGEVIKKYEIPAPKRTPKGGQATTRQVLGRIGQMFGLSNKETEIQTSALGANKQTEDSAAEPAAKKQAGEENEDNRLRFSVGGRRLSTAQFIQELESMAPRRQVQADTRRPTTAEFIQELSHPTVQSPSGQLLDGRGGASASTVRQIPATSGEALTSCISQPQSSWYRSPGKTVRFADQEADGSDCVVSQPDIQRRMPWFQCPGRKVRFADQVADQMV